MRGLVSLGDAERCMLFVPGFMTTPGAYRALLEPLVRDDVCVRILGTVRPGVSALAGRVTATDEAIAVAAYARDLQAQGHSVWLAGHSRGGQVAWRVAEQIDAEGLAVIDPVDGAGPRSGPDLTTRQPAFTLTPLVIALGDGGRCAPADLGPDRFAACAPRARVVTVPGAGHADITTGLALRLGRRLCGGGADPVRVRATVVRLLGDWLG